MSHGQLLCVISLISDASAETWEAVSSPRPDEDRGFPAATQPLALGTWPGSIREGPRPYLYPGLGPATGQGDSGRWSVLTEGRAPSRSWAAPGAESGGAPWSPQACRRPQQMCRGGQRLRAREMPRAGDARRRLAWEPERTPIVVPTRPPAARRLPDSLMAPSDPRSAGPPAPPGLGGHLLLGPDAAPLPETREGPRFFMTPSPFLRWRLCRLCPRPLSSRTGALCSVASRALWPCRDPGRPSTQGRLPVVVVRRENGSEKPEFFRVDFRLSPGRELCRAVGEHFPGPLGRPRSPEVGCRPWSSVAATPPWHRCSWLRGDSLVP